MKHARLSLTAAALLVAVGLRAQTDAPRISQQDFKKLVAAHNVVIVDTRVAEVFEQGHIPGSLQLPLEGRLTWPDEYEKTVVPLLLKTKKPVVVYCA
jgi:rhodanese-related sulfurtransferase